MKKKQRKTGELETGPLGTFSVDYLHVYSTWEGRFIDVSLADMQVFPETLPIACQEHIRSGRPLTRKQQQDLVMLNDMCVSVWYPRSAKPKDVTWQEWSTESYIHLMRYLEKFDRSKGCWIGHIKFAAYDAKNALIGQKIRERRTDKALEALCESISGSQIVLTERANRMRSGRHPED